MNVGKRIKNRRKELGMSADKLAELINKNRATIYRYEKNEIENMPYDVIEPLAKVLNVSPAYLMGWEDQATSLDSLPVKQIPVVSQISAGLPIYSEENLIDYTYIATKNLNVDKELFGLKVSGDSMDKEFKDGEVVIVEKDSVVENGQIGVVQINGYNATVKRVRYNDDQLILLPESNNNEHLPQVYNSSDDVKIIGRVVASQKIY
ncbi:LexA family protein [Staphylococcus arlettae]|uniref:LexA family protein n=1 Tax=Staphylococcus arlettae TaxID=29378 RepID=UPI003A8FC80B